MADIDKELEERIEQLEKEAFINRTMGRNEIAMVSEVCSTSLRRELKNRKDKTNDN